MLLRNCNASLRTIYSLTQSHILTVYTESYTNEIKQSYKKSTLLLTLSVDCV